MASADKSTTLNGVANGSASSLRSRGQPNDHLGDAVDVSVALNPCDLPTVPSLLLEINSLTLGKDISVDRDSRVKLLSKAKALVRALETPRETMIRHVWAQPACETSLAFGVESGLWETMLKNGDRPQEVSELADQLQMDPPLLARIMRHVGAMGYIIETGPDEYQMNNFTKSLTIPIIGNGYPVVQFACNTAFIGMHDFLQKTKYRTPTDSLRGIYQETHRTDKTWFDHLNSNPPHGENFNFHMGGYRQGRPSWMDVGFYPVQERLLDEFNTSQEDAALLVDVGGSIGHDLDEFRRKYPHAPGRLVLQDLPLIIHQIQDLDAKIERMPHDFYTPQPVKGARAYYMHSILHDWPDSEAVKIVQNIKDAMKPGYSKLLINENVIPRTGADSEATGLDIIMMTCFSSKERTYEDWHNLLTKLCGIKIVKIWSAANGVESIIECELP